jgi:hypothetical protein
MLNSFIHTLLIIISFFQNNYTSFKTTSFLLYRNLPLTVVPWGGVNLVSDNLTRVSS